MIRDSSRSPLSRPIPVSRRLARVVCVLFALVGLVPIALAVVARTAWAERWIAAEASRQLQERLGIAAHFEVEVRPWPFAVIVERLVVDDKTGERPFALVERAVAKPHLFSLMSGKIDVGDIEITGARVFAVVRDGKLDNLALPESSSESSGSPDPPISSLSLTDAQIELDMENHFVSLSELDVDVARGPDGSFEASVRAGHGESTMKRSVPGRAAEDAIDEDRLCRFEGRLRLEKGAVLVRRLALEAAVDVDPAPRTRPRCGLPDADWRSLEVALSGVRVALPTPEAPRPESIEGEVMVRVPVPLVHRFLTLAHATGTVGLDATVRYDGKSRLPSARGRVFARDVGIDGKVFSKSFDASVDVSSDVVRVRDASAMWGDGVFSIPEVELRPFDTGMPLRARDIVATDVALQGLLRDLGAHPQAHVGWALDRVDIPKFGGTLDPLVLEGQLAARTHGFGVYDRPATETDKRRLVSHEGGDVAGTLAVRDDAVTLRDMHVTTRASEVFATVRLGYNNDLGIDVGKGSVIELDELTPISTVPIGGKVTVEAHGGGSFDRPRIEGVVSVEQFSLGGFQAGDVKRARATFVPLVLDLAEVELARGESLINAPRVRVDFESGADVAVDADIDSGTQQGLHLQDFFQVFHLEDDPRFEGIDGVVRGAMSVRYALGGPRDRCGGGSLGVRVKAKVDHPTVFGETFDEGDMDVDFDWDDQPAGANGMAIDVRSLALRDASGSITGHARVEPGAILRGDVVISALPVSRLEALGVAGRFVDAEASGVGTLSGTVDRLAGTLDLSVGPTRLGTWTLPGSRVSLKVEPDPTPRTIVARSKCQNPIGSAFDLETWKKDTADGRFLVNGQLFEGQVRLEDLALTRQRNQVVSGRVFLSDFDFGKALTAFTPLAFSNKVVEGKVSAKLDIEHLAPSDLAHSKASLELYDLFVEQAGRRIELDEIDAPIVVADDDVTIPELTLVAKDKSGLFVGMKAGGSVRALTGDVSVDVAARIDPFDLAGLTGQVSGLSRVAGTLSGELAIVGPLRDPRYTGSIALRGGAVTFTESGIALDKAEVDVEVADGEARIVRAAANIGSGTLDVTGRFPLVGGGVGAGSASITARNVKIPVEDGIDLTVSADLLASYAPSSRSDGSQNLPEIRGNVELVSFAYTRPIALSISLNDLTRSLKRTEVDAYDPEGNFVAFDFMVNAQKPLKVENDLAEVRLAVEAPGIQVSGTNQRFGARGSLKVLSDSKVRLRNHEFDVREGYVRFEDPTKLRADIDVRAVTEFRRMASAANDAQTSTTSTSAASGQWDITIHAHGGTDDLKLDLSSEPALDQEDILLLLTLGMTRAEVDRGLITSLGETVGLEALTAITGADRAVKRFVPIIDYFHFGSSYSSKTGRTEPNVTIGKRLTDGIRASVTTTLTEREVGATVDFRLRRGVSVQTSYDNTNEVGSPIGNLGADLRWRLEFE